ncbi:hypothetical protein [Sinorhizobium fredii]
MPVRVDPCIAMLVDLPPKGPGWAFELNGIGIGSPCTSSLAGCGYSRGGYDWTDRFASIATEAQQLAQLWLFWIAPLFGAAIAGIVWKSLGEEV